MSKYLTICKLMVDKELEPYGLTYDDVEKRQNGDLKEPNIIGFEL